jgi:site-specific DNA-methyltransferase (adenine-specific)
MKDRYQIIQGDCRESLKTLTENSVNCCVTSPPYFGLRSYGGGTDEIGIEDRVEDYIQSLVDVFREVRRVLRPDGTLWLNLGDSYMAQKNVAPPPQTIGGQRDMPTGIPGNRKSQNGLKHKDLIGIPWRVALALQADGWWLRQDIIWHKPNPMPESVEDRCTRAHEYIFMLSKKSHYYYDHEAIKETTMSGEEKKNKRSVWTVNTKGYKGAHFAVYPKQLVLPCILAGCPQDGTVLDPFNGSGTTGVVALQNNRRYIGLELNPEYVKLAEARIAEEVSPLTSLFE